MKVTNPDYRHYWAELLEVSDTLLQPDVALILSHDGVKRLLIGNGIFDRPTFALQFPLFNEMFRKELLPLYNLGMSKSSDLFLGYNLSSNGRSLIEDLGILSGTKVTDDASCQFLQWRMSYPSFQTNDRRMHDVKIWRRRIYALGCERFAELIWRPGHSDVERVDKYHRREKRYEFSVFTSPVELLSNEALLESLGASKKVARNRSGSKPRFRLTQKQYREYAPAYKTACQIFGSVLRSPSSRWKYLGKYHSVERAALIKAAFPETDSEIISALSLHESISKVCLRYVGWNIANIPIDGWGDDTWFDVLDKSEELQQR
jgi:hypothetical protein